MKIKKIISGGQTGADQGALAAAKELGLETGGWAPKGFRTEIGPAPFLKTEYGLREHESTFYPPRTRQNVIESSGTLIFGKSDSPGCILTKKYCVEQKVPFLIIPWPYKIANESFQIKHESIRFIEWITGAEILNVAGNRESRNPGIHAAIKRFLLDNLQS